MTPTVESPPRVRITAELRFATDRHLEDLFFRTSETLRVTVHRSESVRVRTTPGRVRLSPTDGTTTNASVTLEFVQTSPRSRTFDTFTGGENWQFVDREFLRLDTTLTADVDLEQHTAFNTSHETVSGNSYTLVGSATTYSRSTDGQDVRLVVPDAASLVEDEDAILDTYDEARRVVPSAGADLEPVLTVFVSPRRTPNQAAGGDVFVGDRMELGGGPDGLRNTWVHELTHTRQEFGQPTPRMFWVTEGSATYYEHLYSYRTGDARFEDLHTYPPDVSHRLLNDTLSDRSTWSSRRTPYVKGARVLYALDVRIRNSTGGKQTIHDVFRRLNAHQADNPHARLSYSTFKTVVERVAGRSLDDWLDRHVTASTPPTPDRRPGLFASTPTDSDDGTSDGERGQSTARQDENSTASPAETGSTADDTVGSGSGSEEGETAATYDADGDGVDIAELGAAAADYARGNLPIAELGEVAATYARS